MAVITLQRWAGELASRGHRGLLLLAGSAAWCRQAALSLCHENSGLPRIWIGDTGGDAIPATKVRQVLGSEYTLTVFDVHSGLHPDALAAVAGTVAGGGVLILLVPEWSQWSLLPDADYSRIASYPVESDALSRRFIAHVQRTLQACLACDDAFLLLEEAAVVREGVAMTMQLPVLCGGNVDGLVPTQEQQAALEQLIAHDGVSVMLAERGRGKSAVLGFAASRFQAEGRRVLLTAPSRQAAAQVFRHCENAQPVFLSPDMILADSSITADVLLVDEAAAISLPLLLGLLRRFSQVIFATTTDGYEGTGQGFVLRFLRELDRCAPGWLSLKLLSPVRWAAGDTVERWLYRLFLLDAHEENFSLPDISLLSPVVEVLSQEALLQSPALLQSVYGLLRSAHYRTTPDDLRFLLDGPGLCIYRLVQDHQTLAVVMVVEEGSIDREMAAEIAAGRRRPRGHLLVQTLAIHLGQPQYLRLRVARVLRIAVHSQYQRSGFGSLLLRAVINDQQQRGVSAIGSSFSATPEVVAFWQANGFDVLRMGSRRQAASAAPAALVLQHLG